MELTPNAWYRFADLFDDIHTLADGSRIWTGGARLAGAPLTALSLAVVSAATDAPTITEHLQLTLEDVPRDSIDGLQDGFAPSMLLREHILRVTQATCGFDLLGREAGLTYRSRGAVCARLDLAPAGRDSVDTRNKIDEVTAAHRRGLLDDYYRSRAHFKLGVKAMAQKVQALRDSAYVPDAEWRVDVVFGAWVGEEDVSPSPLLPGQVLPGSLELQFARRPRRRGFRITDLFRESPATPL